MYIGNEKAEELSAGTGEKPLIHILLVDDHDMMRKGLKKIIDAEEDMQVVGEAVDGEEAVSMAKETSPDIIVMDINMPRMNGIEATTIIMSSEMDLRIIGLSLHDSKEVMQGMLSAGATAYISKDEAFKVLCNTVRREARLAQE